MKIHLLHTNDVHSHLNEYLPLASQIRVLRKQLEAEGETVFQFDIGDHADRMRPETDGTMGLINAALIKAMRYDAWVYGNNEGLIIPRKYWEELCKTSDTPVLNGNLRDLKTGERIPFFADTHLFERNGVKIGVFGLTAPYNEYYHLEGVHALDPGELIPQLVQNLREQGAEIVIFLSHLGLAVDRKHAQNMKGIDVILGSHTHHLLEEPEHVGNVWIAQAGKFAQYFGHVTIDFDERSREVSSVSGRVIPCDKSIQVDADLQDTFDHWKKRADQVLDRTVHEVSSDLAHHFYEESELGNLVADEIKQLSGVEAAFLNTGVFLCGLQRGALTRRMLLACCPSPINPIIIELYGWQIQDILKQGLDPAYTHRRGMGFGFRGKEVGSLALSGMHVIYDRIKGIRNIEIGGNPLDANRSYRVVTADYLVFSGVYDEVAKGRKIGIEPFFLREIMEKALSNPENIQQAKIHRWKEIQPESDGGY